MNRGDTGADKEVAIFRLNPPMPGREQLARVRKGSTALTTLNKVFEEQQELDPEAFDQLVAARGLPLVVVLSNRTTGDGQSSLWIEDVTAVGWGPQAP